MAEYIDKGKILSALDEIEPDESLYEYEHEVWLDCRLEIIHAESEDVAPVKYGRWVYNPNGMDWGLGAWICSECGCKNNNLGMDNRIKPLLFEGSKYCPNCGAKMDGGSKNEIG